MAAIGGGHAVVVSIEILLPIGLVALALAQLATMGTARRFATQGSARRSATLEQRFGVGLGLALAQLLVAVLIGAVVMFVSPHDAWATVGILVFAAVVAARAAQLLLGGVVKDVHAIQDGLHSVQRGERNISIDTVSSVRELEDLAQAANQMIGALGAEEHARDVAETARRQVIAAVSHDLRTPLTSLRLLTEALSDDLVDGATARRYVETMGVQVRTLGALVDDLFELSSLNTGDFAWSTEAVDLPSLIEETITVMRAETEAAGVSVSAELPAGLALARANPQKLKRVLLNLLQNAIHHTPSDGSVVIRAESREGEIEVEVSDTGEGIAHADRPRVFEPFFRGGSEIARTRAGNGLGLAISRSIVEAHGGRIWLADGTDGACVRFTLPRQPAEAGLPALRAAESDAQTPSISSIR
jgi:signal transduction histidine kinase